jgi:hypothetical protein
LLIQLGNRGLQRNLRFAPRSRWNPHRSGERTIGVLVALHMALPALQRPLRMHGAAACEWRMDMNRLTAMMAHALCTLVCVGCAVPTSDSNALSAPDEPSGVAGASAAAPAAVEVGANVEALTQCRTQEIDTSGGHAAYTECTIDGDQLFDDSVRVDGWVRDTDADGKCAQVYGYDSNGRYFESPRACPKGQTHEFHWQSGMVSDISVYLHVN